MSTILLVFVNHGETIVQIIIKHDMIYTDEYSLVDLHSCMNSRLLQNLLQDVLSYQRVIDSVMDKAQTLSSGSSDPRLTTNIAEINNKYGKLQAQARVCISQK